MRVRKLFPPLFQSYNSTSNYSTENLIKLLFDILENPRKKNGYQKRRISRMMDRPTIRSFINQIDYFIKQFYKKKSISSCLTKIHMSR